MSKILVFLAALFLSVAVRADCVVITNKANFTSPAGPTAPGTITNCFNPVAPIAFAVAGKSCTWVSSQNGAGGGAGCNYNLTVDASGNLNGATSNGDGCTASGQAMISACK